MSSLLERFGFPSSKQMEATKAEASVVQVLDTEITAAIQAIFAEAPTPQPAPHEPAAPREPVPVPEATLTPEAELADALRTQYAAIALELGVNQPGLLKDAARAYFRDRGTRLYDGAKVKAYLDDQYGKEGKRLDHQWSPPRRRGIPTWGWRPLRASDVAPMTGSQRQFGYSTSEQNDSIWYYIEPYKKPVPLPVLLTAREIATQFTSARMYVSDEILAHEHRDPVLDPFLLVVIEGERFIVERWDEPAYRE